MKRGGGPGDGEGTDSEDLSLLSYKLRLFRYVSLADVPINSLVFARPGVLAVQRFCEFSLPIAGVIRLVG